MTTTSNPYRELRLLFIQVYLKDLTVRAPETDLFHAEIDKALDGAALLIQKKFSPAAEEITTPNGTPAPETVQDPNARVQDEKRLHEALAKKVAEITQPSGPEIPPKLLELLLDTPGVTYKELQAPPFDLTRRQAESLIKELAEACKKGVMPYEFKTGKRTPPPGQPGKKADMFRLVKR